MAEQGPLSGRLLGNRYQLGVRLGTGGFADVYIGEHIHLKTQCAVKVLHTLLSGEDIEKFRDEARLVAHLEHPNILKVRDFDLEDSTPFLVMDYAPHGSLRQRHLRGERLPLSTLVSYVQQIADALQYAHDERVIHRDIKPENLLLGRSNNILLSDFGIAVVAQSASQQYTQGIAGTPAYSAPEQLLGRPHPASDQYALGIVIYEWLAGVLPFQGAPWEVISQHLYTPPSSLLDKVPGLAPAVEQVVFTALAKTPSERFKHVRAFATALASACQPAVAPTIPPPPAQPGPATGPTTPAVSPPIGTASWPPPGTSTVPDASSGSPLLSKRRPPSPVPGALPRGTTLVIYKPSEEPVPGDSSDRQQRDLKRWFALAWSPDGQRIACGSTWEYTYYVYGDGLHRVAGRVEVWDVITGKTLEVYSTGDFPFEGLFEIVWSPDGKYVVVLGQKALIWAWKAKKEIKRKVKEGIFRLREREVVESVEPLVETFGGYSHSSDPEISHPSVLLWSPDLSKVAALGYGARSGGTTGLQVVALREREPIVQKSVSARDCNGDAVAWSPDSTRIAWGTGNEIPVWDVRNPEQEGHHLLTYREHRSPVAAVSWSPDGKQIASRSEDGSGLLWDAERGQTLGTFTGPAEKIKDPSALQRVLFGTAISPDGTLKAIPTDDGIELQTVADGTTVFVYREHCSDKTAQHWSPEVKARAWSPDAARFAFARFDGKIYVLQAV